MCKHKIPKTATSQHQKKSLIQNCIRKKVNNLENLKKEQKKEKILGQIQLSTSNSLKDFVAGLGVNLVFYIAEKDLYLYALFYVSLTGECSLQYFWSTDCSYRADEMESCDWTTWPATWGTGRERRGNKTTTTTNTNQETAEIKRGNDTVLEIYGQKRLKRLHVKQTNIHL